MKRYRVFWATFWMVLGLFAALSLGFYLGAQGGYAVAIEECV